MNEILKASINYFNYEKTTKFDVKPNTGDNYPLFLSIYSIIPINKLKKKLAWMKNDCKLFGIQT